jgi:hypothetical protein
MIERLKECLQRIREDRLKKMEAFDDRKGEDARNKYRDILTLELPHDVDEKNKYVARGSIYTRHEAKRDEKLKKTPQELILDWQNTNESSERKEKAALCDFLQHRKVLRYYYHHNGTPEPYSIEQFSKVVELEGMLFEIDNCDLNDEFKNRYKLHAESLHNYIHKDLFLFPLIRKRHPHATLAEMAQFFNYLENRAMKGSTIRAFEDIILCRAIEYIPVPAKKLFALGPPRGQLCEFEGNTILLPLSFIELRKELSEDQRLISRAFGENQLSKKIKRLGKYAGLPECFNLSVLRNSIGSIQAELSIDQELKMCLKPR